MSKRIFTGFLRSLEEVAGTRAVRALLAAKGGQRVRMPSLPSLRKGRSAWLVLAVGGEAAEKIADTFPISMEVHLPLGVSAERRRRKALALRMLRTGAPMSEIIGTLKISRSSLKRFNRELKG